MLQLLQPSDFYNTIRIIIMGVYVRRYKMEKKVIFVLLVGLFCIAGSISTGIKVEEKNRVKNIQNTHEDQYYEDYSVMRVSPKTLERWEEEYNNPERA